MGSGHHVVTGGAVAESVTRSGESSTASKPNGGASTPPTQWITPPVVTLRVRCAVTWGLPSAGPFADGDAVPDGGLLGSDEDVVDQQPEQVLAVSDAGGVGVAAQLGEEAASLR